MLILEIHPQWGWRKVSSPFIYLQTSRHMLIYQRSLVSSWKQIALTKSNKTPLIQPKNFDIKNRTYKGTNRITPFSWNVRLFKRILHNSTKTNKTYIFCMILNWQRRYNLSGFIVNEAFDNLSCDKLFVTSFQNKHRFEHLSSSISDYLFENWYTTNSWKVSFSNLTNIIE